MSTGKLNFEHRPSQHCADRSFNFHRFRFAIFRANIVLLKGLSPPSSTASAAAPSSFLWWSCDNSPLVSSHAATTSATVMVSKIDDHTN